MRIVHYLNSVDLRDGGVVRAVLDLCSGLGAAGHEVTLLTCNEADVPAEWRSARPWETDHPASVLLPRPALPGGLLGGNARAAAKKIIAGAEVVHLHAMWIPSNDQLAADCRAMGRPYIISPHGMLDDWCMAQKALKKRVYHALIEKRALEGAACVHCTAEAELEQASKWFGRGMGTVVPLPFDLADYRELPGPEMARAKFGLRAEETTLLFLSRLHPKKGVEVLIRAGAALRDAGRPVRLVIAGGGEEGYVRRLHGLVAELKMEERASFVGFVKGAEKVSLYQAADAFVLPTSQENFGYVVVEALAAARPVITTRGVALWPQLERERAAMLVEPTVGEVVGAVESVLGDRAGSAAMGARGRAWCVRELDPVRIIAGFVEMYERAAAKEARAGVGSSSL